jgi:hypothetical protein
MRSFLATMLLLVSAEANAQTLTDVYGRVVTVSGNSYSVTGITITAPDQASAISVLNSMAPSSYVFPVPPAPNLAAQSENDCALVSSGTCTLPAGTGLSQWTGSGTLATYTVVLPSNPIVGPQSELQINVLGTGTITALAIQSPAGTTLKTVAIAAPKVYRLEYTNSGWAVLPN